MSGAESAIYVGAVVHRRLRPRRHRLAYRHFMLLLDIDQLGALARSLSLFRLGRFGLFSLNPSDYGSGGARGLRDHVEAQLAAAGIVADGGPVRLLTVPRILGYAFNPLSLYFCHRRDGAIAAVLCEVNNTFGQRHSYLLRGSPATPGFIGDRCAKAFYVSPFLDMDLDYGFRIHAPGDDALVAVSVRDDAGVLMTAMFAGKRRDLSDGALLRLFLTMPLAALKVIFGIHFEALRLWLKGIRLRPRPSPPLSPLTLADASPVQSKSGS
jgi:DUF1365 family protein